jgi:hypothetical protein
MFRLAKISKDSKISLLRRILILPTLWRLGPSYIYVEGEIPIFDPSSGEAEMLDNVNKKLDVLIAQRKAEAAAIRK